MKIMMLMRIERQRSRHRGPRNLARHRFLVIRILLRVVKPLGCADTPLETVNERALG